MNEQDISNPAEESAETEKETHPLIKLGILSVGTKIGATLILRLAKYPALLFGMGAVAGFYVNKNRQDILDAAAELKEQGLKVIGKKDSD